MLYLVGCGPLSIEYARVFKAQNRNFEVIGRGNTSADKFEKATGIKPKLNGIEKFLRVNKIQERSEFIIVTGTEALMIALKAVLVAGASKVLVEKPAAVSMEELLANQAFLKPYLDRVFVAYNRRFYASVLETERLIQNDGGLRSMHFEFTEWAHKVEPLDKPTVVKNNWFFANSSHVIDTAFMFAGRPRYWSNYSKKGNINWHDKVVFSGAGITEKSVIFSYLADWESSGRWSIELLTNNRRIYLRPLEAIYIQRKGKLDLEHHLFDDNLDTTYKPGLYLQVKAFLSNEDARLLTLRSQIENVNDIYLNFL
ncbi:MAG: gfo/Idh/MocA family oxidoreductase [Bacteroidota bacterium]